MTQDRNDPLLSGVTTLEVGPKRSNSAPIDLAQVATGTAEALQAGQVSDYEAWLSLRDIVATTTAFTARTRQRISTDAFAAITRLYNDVLTTLRTKEDLLDDELIGRAIHDFGVWGEHAPARVSLADSFDRTLSVLSQGLSHIKSSVMAAPAVLLLLTEVETYSLQRADRGVEYIWPNRRRIQRIIDEFHVNQRAILMDRYLQCSIRMQDSLRLVRDPLRRPNEPTFQQRLARHVADCARVMTGLLSTYVDDLEAGAAIGFRHTLIDAGRLSKSPEEAFHAAAIADRIDRRRALLAEALKHERDSDLGTLRNSLAMEMYSSILYNDVDEDEAIGIAAEARDLVILSLDDSEKTSPEYVGRVANLARIIAIWGESGERADEVLEMVQDAIDRIEYSDLKHNPRFAILGLLYLAYALDWVGFSSEAASLHFAAADLYVQAGSLRSLASNRIGAVSDIGIEIHRAVPLLYDSGEHAQALAWLAVLGLVYDGVET